MKNGQQITPSDCTDELVMGFNPFLAGPTNEGLEDGQ